LISFSGLFYVFQLLFNDISNISIFKLLVYCYCYWVGVKLWINFLLLYFSIS